MDRSIIHGLAASLLGFGLVGCSGVDVQGVVRDRDGRSAVSGATVQIGETTTQTDSSGYYSVEVEGDDDENQRVTVQAPGYKPHTEIVTIREDPEQQVFDFALESKEEQKAASSDVKVDVRTGEPRRGEEQPAGYERDQKRTTTTTETGSRENTGDESGPQRPQGETGEYEYEYERKTVEETEPR